MGDRDDRGRFAPGSSGNPRGAPRRGTSLAEAVDRYLRQGKRRKFADKLYRLFTENNNVAAARLLAYILGEHELQARITRLEERLDLRDELEAKRYGEKG